MSQFIQSLANHGVCGLGVLITVQAELLLCGLECCCMIWFAAMENAGAGLQVSAA